MFTASEPPWIAPFTNDRYSTNHQVVIDAHTRLVIAHRRPRGGKLTEW